MKQAEQVRRLSEITGFDQKSTKQFLKGFVQMASEAIAYYGRLAVTDLGIFEVKERAGREMRCNLATVKGEENVPQTIEIPPRRYVKFKAATALKEAVQV